MASGVSTAHDKLFKQILGESENAASFLAGNLDRDLVAHLDLASLQTIQPGGRDWAMISVRSSKENKEKDGAIIPQKPHFALEVAPLSVEVPEGAVYAFRRRSSFRPPQETFTMEAQRARRKTMAFLCV